MALPRLKKRKNPFQMTKSGCLARSEAGVIIIKLDSRIVTRPSFEDSSNARLAFPVRSRSPSCRTFVPLTTSQFVVPAGPISTVPCTMSSRTWSTPVPAAGSAPEAVSAFIKDKAIARLKTVPRPKFPGASFIGGVLPSLYSPIRFMQARV